MPSIVLRRGEWGKLSRFLFFVSYRLTYWSFLCVYELDGQSGHCACNGGQKCFIPLIFVLKGYVKNHLARCSSYPMGGVSWDTSWGKLSMDRKSEPLLFPGAAKSGLFYLLHGIHTYGKVFFLHQKVTVLSLPIARQFSITEEIILSFR